MLPSKSYIICTNPRSGSWLLAEGLESTGRAGMPREWFEITEERKFTNFWQINFSDLSTNYQEYFDRIIPAGTTNNQIFGAKCMGQDLESLIKKLSTIPRFSKTPRDQLIQSAFPNPHFIWLRRKDLLRQAISYTRANNTRVWWTIEGKEAPKVEETFDLEGINYHKKLLEDFDEAWFAYFAENAIIPLEIYYEDFTAHYEQTILNVLHFLDVKDLQLSDIKPPRLKKQADQITEDWVSLYTKDNS